MDIHYPVLDHGFVKLDDHLGTDLDIARLARASTGGGNKAPEVDAKFLDYLWRHGHMSPFEMPMVRLELKMPIAMARQWVRHRLHSMNEMSARYVELPEEYYAPLPGRMIARDTDNRQASGGVDNLQHAGEIADGLDMAMDDASASYRIALAEGAPKEVARFALPVSTYTTFYWQQNLRSLLDLLRLRLHDHAQWETRQYAEAVYAIVKDLFPVTAEVFERNTLNAQTFSEPEMLILRTLLEADQRNQRLLGALSEALPPSVRREFRAKISYRTDLLEGAENAPEDPMEDAA